jgi:hypothetical protein
MLRGISQAIALYFTALLVVCISLWPVLSRYYSHRHPLAGCRSTFHYWGSDVEGILDVG